MYEQQKSPVYVNDAGLTRFLGKVYGYMAMGVGISAVISYLIMTQYYAQVLTFVAQNTWSIWALMIVQLIVAASVSVTSFKNPAISMVSYVIYSALNGVVFSIILSAYTGTDVTSAFVSAVVLFATMSIWALNTKKDISSWGSYLRPALIALIVASVINLFFLNSVVDFFLSIISVVIFTGLTAWDNQMLKRMYATNPGQAALNGLAINGAFQLYLDFINLFLSLLRMFTGGSRN